MKQPLMILAVAVLLGAGVLASPASATDRVYWIHGRSIEAADSPGGPVTTIITPPLDAFDNGRPVFLNTYGNRLYWTTYGRNELWSSTMYGQDAHLMVNTLTTYPRGMAFDGNNVYWGGETETYGHIYRWNLSGASPVSTIYTGPNGYDDTPEDIEIYNGRIYWTTYASSQVHSTDLTGGDLQTISLAGIASLAFAIDIANDHMYIADNGTSSGRVLEYSMDGQSYRVLANHDSTDLWVNGDRVYCNDEHQQQIYSVPLLGGPERLEVNSNSWKLIVVPEPSTLVLLGIAAFVVLAHGWRWRQRR